MKGTTLIVRTDGRTELVTWGNPRDLLPYLKRAVGGHIEGVPYFHKLDLGEGVIAERAVAFCNEEGKLEGLPFNEYAQHLWERVAPDIAKHDMLCGNIVVVFGDDEFMKEL